MLLFRGVAITFQNGKTILIDPRNRNTAVAMLVVLAILFWEERTRHPADLRPGRIHRLSIVSYSTFAFDKTLHAANQPTTRPGVIRLVYCACMKLS
jgi:hypothetical protein